MKEVNDSLTYSWRQLFIY